MNQVDQVVDDLIEGRFSRMARGAAFPLAIGAVSVGSYFGQLSTQKASGGRLNAPRQQAVAQVEPTKAPPLTPVQRPQTAFGKASWYSRESCAREGTGGKDIRMANNRPLDDNALTCAIWGPKFGTKLKVTNLDNNQSVVVTVTDRGPGRGPWRKDVLIDLTMAAWKKLGAPLSKGIIDRVKVEPVK